MRASDVAAPLALALASMLGACGALTASSDTTKPPETGDAAIDAAPADAGDDAVDAAPKCAPGATVTATIEADTGLSPTECAQSVHHGNDVNMNARSDWFILTRFTLSSAVEQALSTHAVHSMRLTLVENTHCDTSIVCLANTPGTFEIRPARTDWDEGTAPYVSYGGADSCRRLAGATGAGWGANPKASTLSRIAEGVDYGAPAATFELTDPLGSLVFDLDGDRATFPIRTPTSIAFLVRATSTGVFVAAQKESKLADPKLEITLCQ
jgi:hypothetical protein